MFPFPDYKLPQSILDEHFIDNDENAYSLLYRISSRDYLKPWKPGINEFAVWRALHRSHQLKEYANSFLIVAGKNPSCLKKMLKADFTYFSGGSRKPKYRTITIKKFQENEIVKKHLLNSGDLSGGTLNQKVSTSTLCQRSSIVYPLAGCAFSF